MAASLEHQLVSKILELQDFHTAEKLRIAEDFFFSPECREIFRFIRKHFHSPQTFNSVPSTQLVSQIFAGFQPSPSPDSLSTLCDQIRQAKMRVEILSAAEQISERAESNPREAMEMFREAVAVLSTRHDHSNDLLMSDAYDILRAEYDLVANSQGVTGLPWAWAPINEATQGIHKGEFILIYGRMKHMKCVVAGQKIMMRDGSLIPIEEVHETTEVPSYTNETGSIRWATANRVASGDKECVEVVTKSGLTLRTSTEHPYMVPGGTYKKIEDLKPGDYIATARQLPKWEPSSQITPDEGRVLGLLVGDGNYTRGEVQFSNQDEEIVHSLSEIVRQRFGCTLSKGWWDIDYRIVCKGQANNPLLDWLQGLGISGQKSSHKTVPAELFRSKPSTIRAFLGGYLDTDGTVSDDSTMWSSSSRQLLEGVQHLLNRFGIRGRICQVTTNYNTTAFFLTVSSREQNTKLFHEIGEYIGLSRKRDALRRLKNKETLKKRNVDGIPYTDALLAKILTAKGSNHWPKTGRSKFSKGKLFIGGKISRDLLRKLAEAFQAPELAREAETEIIWEKIKSIEHIGRRPCFDICIADGQDPNFVVQDFVVHNSWLALYTLTIINMYANARAIVYSLEMPTKQIARRIAAIRTGIDYKNLIAGKLQPADRDAYFRTLWALKQAKSIRDPNEVRTPDLLIVDGKRGGISFLHAKIREFRPDIVLVDGCYLMKDDRQNKRTIDWKAIAHISQDLKGTAMDFDIPIIGTAQANRKADRNAKNADLSEVAYSDAFGQDTDFSIRVQKRKDKSTGNPELVLAFPGSRETDLDAILINGIPATDFSLKSTHVTTEKSDDDDDGNHPKAQHNGTAHSAVPRLPQFGGGLSGDKAL